MESNLVNHAKRELELGGWFDKDRDFYGGMTGTAVLELVETFAKQGHSGMSASIVTSLLEPLLNWKSLGALTDSPEEWEPREMPQGRIVWQNKRQSSCFSRDAGQTYYDHDDRRRWVWKLPFKLRHRLPLSFQYHMHKTKKAES